MFFNYVIIRTMHRLFGAVILVLLLVIIYKEYNKCSCGCGCGVDCECVHSADKCCCQKTENYESNKKIVLHYTNWCPACEQMKPVYNSVKNDLQSKTIKFSEVDEDVAHTPGIDGYPTILMYQDGRAYRYPGGSDVGKLKRWILAPNK